MSDSGKEFVDPTLKRAVRHAYAGERAPESLRLKVIASIEQISEPNSADRPMKIGRNKSPWLKYAVAALVALSLAGGIEYWMLYEPEAPSGPSSPNVYVFTLPQMYQSGMTEGHARPAPVVNVDRVAAGTSLSKSIGQKVIAPDIAGWTFKSFEPLSIADHPAARVIYTRGQETLSVFSMIADASYPPPDGTLYDDICMGSTFAGIVHKGMIYCVYTQSDKPESLKEVKDIRDAFAKTL